MIKRYKKNEIEKLVKILKNDGVISVPTDTVFIYVFIIFIIIFHMFYISSKLILFLVYVLE